MTAIRLALGDLWHEPLVCICQVLALAAVLAPLLVIWGLKQGVMSALLDELRSDPANRQIVIVGSQVLRPEQVDVVRAHPGVGFVAPMPRSFGREIYLSRDDGTDLVRATLLPSGPGDPVLPAGTPPLTPGQIALAPELALRLSAQPGALLQASNTRNLLRGRPERLTLTLEVKHVLAPGLAGRSTVVAHPEDLAAVELFLDGYALPERDIATGSPASDRARVFEGLRLYAQRLADVEELSAWLSGPPLRLQVSSRAAEIARLQRLDRNLTTVFTLLVALGGGGYGVSLAASHWANVQRKRRSLSIVRLLGARRWVLLGFPLIQAAVVAIAGGLAAVGLSLAMGRFVNNRFADLAGAGQPIYRSDPLDFIIAVGLTLALALAAAGAGALRATGVEPTEGLRDA